MFNLYELELLRDAVDLEKEQIEEEAARFQILYKLSIKLEAEIFMREAQENADFNFPF